MQEENNNNMNQQSPQGMKKISRFFKNRASGSRDWHLPERLRLFFNSLWRNIRTFRPSFKVLDISKVKEFTKRPDFMRIVVVACVVVWFLGTLFAGLHRVREGEVGLRINNITGNLEIKNDVGIYLTNPYISNFFTLNKTVQSLDMSFTTDRLVSPDEVRIKTRDGSSVSLNVTINYKLIPEKADLVIRLSGKERAFSAKWIRIYSRAIALDRFGELNTEEFYDTALRNERARLAKDDLNDLLNPFGIEIVSVIPRDFRFYKEYEEVIKTRKVVDQSVEEQVARAANAIEEQKRRITEEESKGTVEIARALSEAERKIVEASGQARKVMIDADSYAYQRTVEADGSLFAAQKESEGIIALGEAEAKGYERLREALRGSGGQNLIALEYAKKLKEIEFVGTPVTHEGRIPQINLRNIPSVAGSSGQDK